MLDRSDGSKWERLELRETQIAVDICACWYFDSLHRWSKNEPSLWLSGGEGRVPIIITIVIIDLIFCFCWEAHLRQTWDGDDANPDARSRTRESSMSDWGHDTLVSTGSGDNSPDLSPTSRSIHFTYGIRIWVHILRSIPAHDVPIIPMAMQGRISWPSVLQASAQSSQGQSSHAYDTWGTHSFGISRFAE